MERWHTIIREAAEQSRRARLPALHQVVSFREACEQINKPALIFWEGEKSMSLAVTLKSAAFTKARAISIFVGPEGGFAQAEIEIAWQHGTIPVGLGKRILRAETAGLVATSAIMYEKGELG
jgi:16S rRNA (uracil1498-N3)-methyltransferase